jgi:hypothetical protein
MRRAHPARLILFGAMCKPGAVSIGRGHDKMKFGINHKTANRLPKQASGEARMSAENTRSKAKRLS